MLAAWCVSSTEAGTPARSGHGLLAKLLQRRAQLPQFLLLQTRGTGHDATSGAPWAVVGCPQLFDLVYREETLLNVIKSVTRNGRSIILTAVLALILVYLFSIVGYLFFKDDFILEVDKLPNETLLPGQCGRLVPVGFFGGILAGKLMESEFLEL